MDQAKKNKQLLSIFSRRLTNLSAHNRSLLLLKPSEQFIDLHTLSQLNGAKSFSIIEALIAEKNKIICPLADPRMESANAVSLKLKKLQRIDQFIFDERGSRDLHVGWPFVRGKFSEGTSVRCPLVFFPVELIVVDGNWFLSFRLDGEIVFNKSFLLAYSFYNKVKADESLLNEPVDETDRDSTSFRTALYKLLQQSSIALNFNSDNYRDELIPFLPFTKKEFEEAHRPGELKLFPEAVLGIFQQAGSSLVQDYGQLLEENSFQDLEEVFSRHRPIAGTQTDNFISKVREEKVYSIFPADIWQENALKASKLGHSIVVQGPPGTGKSQLIGNLISDCIANGKRVLLVCQKRAALDVVYARLCQMNLGNFLGLVHDFKTDRKEVFEKIASQINHTDEYKKKNISLDAIQLDRQFLQVSKRIDQVTEELENFRTSLFDESECGSSIKELYLKSDPSDAFISLKQEYHQFKFGSTEHFFLRALNQYADYAKWGEQDTYLLKDRKSFASFSVGDLPLIRKSIDEVFPFFQRINEGLTKTINAAPDWEQLLKLGEKLNELNELAKRTSREDIFVCFKKMLAEKSAETNSLWLSNIERMMMDCFAGDGPEVSVPSALLGHFQKALHRGRQAQKGLWSWVRWQIFSKDKMMITRALVANQLQSDKAGFKLLEEKLDQRLNLEHNLSKLKNKKWLLHVPDIISKQLFTDWFASQQLAILAKSNFNAIRGLKNLLNPTKLNAREFHHKLQVLINAVTQVQEKGKIWSAHLSGSQVAKLSKEATLASKLIALLNHDFDSLCEFDKLKQNLTTLELGLIERLRDKLGSYEAAALQKMFLNSLSLTWIDHLETKNPELRMVSSGRIQRLEVELQEQIEMKQNLSAEILLLRARERVTDDLEFNRLNNRVSYRDLVHQVTKKKKIWPLRKVVSEFEEEVFRLLPCWLASPESVSAIFPMKEIFDLVIFDEASQCFAERGIPALYRGKQTVIAGDSQQLRPGDFYQARWQEEDFDEPDAEVDSLLELSERYLMTLKLNGHYRSQSLELIDFSNKYFYDGQLQLLPDFHHLNKQQPAIEFHKTDGVWANNSNEIEARHIAELVLKLATEKPLSEIGVVTFNAPQQALVLDCLEEAFSTARTTLPEGVFVKNIENVQGDERDIIIFSIGYAADAKGNIRVQFGSLNGAGGENRLNVAVSRARQKIIVVSSLWPEQLEVGETKNEGPKLLKAYLLFAREVALGNFKPFVRAGRKSPFSMQLKKKLTGPTGNTETELTEDTFPFHDLTVRRGERFNGAIFTDDNFYFESLSAKAPHALLPQLLSKKNWPYRRVYSRNFWSDRKRVENEVKGFD